MKHISEQEESLIILVEFYLKIVGSEMTKWKCAEVTVFLRVVN